METKEREGEGRGEKGCKGDDGGEVLATGSLVGIGEVTWTQPSGRHIDIGSWLTHRHPVASGVNGVGRRAAVHAREPVAHPKHSMRTNQKAHRAHQEAGSSVPRSKPSIGSLFESHVLSSFFSCA
eukprot:scaffold222115_cov27-Tisochrysis_lutea.AAC.1